MSICADTGNIYAGLYYPITIAGVTLVVGSLCLRETHGSRIWDEAESAQRHSKCNVRLHGTQAE